MEWIVDGNFSLSDQENSLNYSQNLSRAEVSGYKAEQSSTENLATAEEVGLGQPVRPVKLQEDEQGENVYVEGTLKKISFTHA